MSHLSGYAILTLRTDLPPARHTLPAGPLEGAIARRTRMLNEELLAILACPACKTKVKLVADKWLVCQNPECRRKYPIRDDIPIMLIEEGSKYVDVSEEDIARMEP